MKLVSPKTLLASLLGCTFVVMKVMTFDGLVDMFWIILIGYLTVKAIVTAFSQEAYDEDIRQAQQGKVLYRDLFGKFAYIAADVPILLILLAGLFGFGLFRNNATQSHPDGTSADCSGICYLVQLVCFKA